MPFVEHASQAVLGWGTYLAIGNSAGAVVPPATDVFVNMVELISVEPPDEQADDIEVTHFGSPGRTKEYIRGLIDAGEATFGINYQPVANPDAAALVVLRKSGEIRNIRLVLAGAIETIDFPGYIKGFKRNLGANDAITADVTLKVAGAVVSDLDTP